MTGTKVYKPVSDWGEYAKCAAWCNANGAMIVEHEDCYEVVATPAPTFDELKDRKLAELSSSYEERVAGSVFIPTENATYLMQFNRSDSLAVQGMIELMEATGQNTGYLTQADDTTVYDVSLAEIKTVLVGMLQAYTKCHAKKQEYRQQINDAQTSEDLDAIVFEWEV